MLYAAKIGLLLKPIDFLLHCIRIPINKQFPMTSPQTTIAEIQHHSPQKQQAPFTYVYVEDFFTTSFHKQLCEAFEQVKREGLTDSFSYAQFSRFGGYDAYYWLFPPNSDYPLHLFYSPEWRDYFASLFDIPLTSEVVAEFHHHQVGSSDGFVHNDYNLCCFTNHHLPNGINPWYYHCSYDPAQNDMQSGFVSSKMRSIAVIYYLNNEEWQPGDGGETALLDATRDLQTATLIPPKSNSLLAFEVSPLSFHGFMQNRRLERNSLIMWFHTETALKLARHNNTPPVAYGADS